MEMCYYTKSFAVITATVVGSGRGVVPDVVVSTDNNKYDMSM